MKVNYNFLSLINVISFIICLVIYVLPNFIDSDINRIFLSKLNFKVFDPCFLLCLVLSIFNISNKNKIKYTFIISNYVVLLFVCLFILKIVFVMLFT